jgi:hypothetical protein
MLTSNETPVFVVVMLVVDTTGDIATTSHTCDDGGAISATCSSTSIHVVG